MKVLVVTGGTSSERPVSLKSAKQVKKGLEEKGHKAKLFDLKKGHLALKKIANLYDVLFPVVHGEEGEGGELQKFLTTLGKPFVGGSSEGFKQGWYKIPFKEFCDKNNIPTAPWKKIKTIEDVKKFGIPCVAKSTTGGSSKEVAILETPEDLKKSLFLNLFKLGQPLYVEKFINGVEITVAIFNNQALPVLEIVPPQGGWFDYKNKYSGETQEIPHAPSVSIEAQQKAQEIALMCHQKLKLGPYSRIDFIVSDNTPYILEVNTIPGLTPTSLFPKAAAAVGISFSQLMDKLVKTAYENKIPETK